MKNILSAFILSSILFIAACNKYEFDSPPIRNIPVGNILTLGDLREMHNGQTIRFTGDTSVFAVITMDERSGNLYKNVYAEDATGAINIRLLSSGGVYEGDSVRLYLKGCYLSVFNGVLQLDSVNIDNNIIKQAVGKFRQPTTVTIDQINSEPGWQSKLVKIENVQFASADANKPWADAPNLASVNRTLTDCDGNTIIVRTSGYAGFAAQNTPGGNGSIIAIAGEFGTTKQLYVRTPTEATLTNDRCGATGAVQTLQESFDNVGNNTDYVSNLFENRGIIGSRVWRGRIFDADKYITAGAFGSFDASNESWLITVPIINSPTKKLSFRSAQAFWTHQGLTVMISTNYEAGGDPNAATWLPITANLANATNSNYQWVTSGVIELAGYLPQGYEGNFYIGFRYQGNAGGGLTGTSALDDILITD